MKYIFFCLLLGTVANSFAQDGGERRFKFNYISFETNGYSHRSSDLNATLTDDLVKQNSQVAMNMKSIDSLLSNSNEFGWFGYGYGHTFGYYMSGMGYNSNSMSALSVQLVDQKTKRFEGRLTLGLGTGSASVGNLSRYYTTSGRYDTLVSKQTGEETYVDTTYIRYFNFNAYTRLTSVQVGYELHSKNDKRFHFYTGANLNLAFSGKTRVSVSDYINSTSVNQEYVSKFESYELNSSYFIGQLAIPLGVEMKLGMKDNLFKNISLRANLRGMLSMSSSAYTATNIGASFGGGIGILFRFP